MVYQAFQVLKVIEVSQEDQVKPGQLVLQVLRGHQATQERRAILARLPAVK